MSKGVIGRRMVIYKYDAVDDVSEVQQNRRRSKFNIRIIITNV